MDILDIKLQLNNRLNNIKLINIANNILNKYYRENSRGVFHNVLLDRFDTYYNVIETLNDVKYNEFELKIIANKIWNMKGSIYSIYEFCKYFNIKILSMNSNSYNRVKLTIGEVNTDNLIKFDIELKKLIHDLLLSSGATDWNSKYGYANYNDNDESIDILYDSYILKCEVNNDIKINVSTGYIKYFDFT